MKEVRTDRGTEYVNQVFENIANFFNVTHKVTTAYHSQSIGGCERNHRVLNEFMRMYIHETHSDWEDWIRYYTFCYNTTHSTYHQYTPFEQVFGKKCNLPQSISAGRIDSLYNIDAYNQEIRYRLQIAQKRAQEWLQIAKRYRKIAYDKKAQHTEVRTTNESRHKFDPWYIGPYTVTKLDGPNCTIKNNE
ncbi:hypothetical protein QE152_g35321 [Popillia japonica]|uniref:Integrase catalytic domain-containing protein n=1 Tax=Popillia japonica TaxID=7064 RepID=A0AAW1IG66_POPJA